MSASRKMRTLFEMKQGKTYEIICGLSKDSDQSVPLCSLMRALACPQWVVKDSRLLHAENEASDQTAQMCRLIRLFTGRTSLCMSYRNPAHLL